MKAKRPKAILLENVKQFETHDDGQTYRTIIQSLTSLGYFTHTTVLNASITASRKNAKER